MNDIVYDVTGFDMNVITKEDLHKDYVDECLSAPRFTPEQQEPEPEPEPKAEEPQEVGNISLYFCFSPA